jgi:hypothetical protein
MKTWIFGTLPPAVVLFLFYIENRHPSFFQLFTMKDNASGGGIIEIATVLILIPAVFFGMLGFFKARKLQLKRVGLWLLFWTMACFFFAGEEISWGQWFFHWETPDKIKELNDQGETNLHNLGPIIGPIFDQIPRACVEFAIICGTFISILRKLNIEIFKKENMLVSWLIPHNLCISAGMTFFLLWFNFHIFNPKILSKDVFKCSEIGEFYVALFLFIYIFSIKNRLNSKN